MVEDKNKLDHFTIEISDQIALYLQRDFKSCANDFRNKLEARARELAAKMVKKELDNFFKNEQGKINELGGLNNIDNVPSIGDMHNDSTCSNNSSTNNEKSVFNSSDFLSSNVKVDHSGYIKSSINSSDYKSDVSIKDGGLSSSDNFKLNEERKDVIVNLRVIELPVAQTKLVSSKAPLIKHSSTDSTTNIYLPKESLDDSLFDTIYLSPEMDLVDISVDGKMIKVAKRFINKSGSVPFTKELLSNFQQVIDKSLVFLDNMNLSYNIFYDHCFTLGFNLNGHIYLNLASFNDKISFDSSAADWASIILHELTHNRQSYHGIAFINDLQRSFSHIILKLNMKLNDLKTSL